MQLDLKWLQKINSGKFNIVLNLEHKLIVIKQ